MINKDSLKYLNEKNHSCIAALKVNLKHYESQRQILEVKVIKQNRMRSEVQDLQFQLENIQQTIDTINQQQSYDNVQQDFDTISSKYIQLKDRMNNLNQINQEFQCSIQCKKIKELETIDKIKKLKINEAQTVDNINKLQEKIQKELVISTILLL